MAELADSVRRVLGAELPMSDPKRLSRFTFKDRQAETYRAGRILLAGDAAHLLPATGTALNVDMVDAVHLGWKLAAEVQGWAPGGRADALLIRPDGHIAWAAEVGEPTGTAAPALRDALAHWFGAPLDA
ncbi:FAD-dependent monooxygenase [Nocardia brasiliensis]|uniref:FAD-dependent monooxygenase n=1 Tax=Nocardia brasiliensis TaxID=37326 RepID=UPI0023AEC30E|nr:FAD-dependent monooxygenase [Nocardia brasiliensis]